MDEKTLERIGSRWKRYPGFGLNLSASEWARLTGIPRTTVWRNLQHGLSIEQIVRVRDPRLYEGMSGEKPSAEAVQAPKRKQRTGVRLQDTEALVHELLCVSGINPDGLAVVPKTNQSHIIWLGDNAIGKYWYIKDVLDLSNGEMLKLKDPVVDLQAIRQRADGLWEIHPDTRRAMHKKWLTDRGE